MVQKINSVKKTAKLWMGKHKKIYEYGDSLWIQSRIALYTGDQSTALSLYTQDNI
jgi:hypothetical protein